MNSVNDCPRSGLPKKVPEDHYQCIDNAMAENDELTASDVKGVLSRNLVQTKCNTASELLEDCEMISVGHTLQRNTARQFGMQAK